VATAHKISKLYSGCFSECSQTFRLTFVFHTLVPSDLLTQHASHAVIVVGQDAGWVKNNMNIYMCKMVLPCSRSVLFHVLLKKIGK